MGLGGCDMGVACGWVGQFIFNLLDTTGVALTSRKENEGRVKREKEKVKEGAGACRYSCRTKKRWKADGSKGK